jgi:hypothetical protein
MAAPAIPLLAAAGAALLLSGGKKKKRGPRSGQKCDVDAKAPTGFLCEEGLLKEESVDEGELDSDSDLSKDEAGDFDTDEEDVGIGEGEDQGEMEDEPAPAPDPAKTCEEFMQAVHVETTTEGEIPINAVAVEESVLPAMRENAASIAASLGLPLDIEMSGPVLVVTGLNALIPVCDWKYELGEGFTYNDGASIVSQEAKDVIYGLIELSVSVIEEINTPEPQAAEFQPQG